MKLVAINSIFLALAIASPALAVDWMFAPSTFTHDPQTSQRVSQYATHDPVFVYTPPDYQRSGYRHNTSVNRVGGNADRIHIVEEWGRSVRPYGEWLRPYRPYSVPYDLWGPPFGGLGNRRGFPGGGFGPGPGFPRPWLGPYPQPPRAAPYGGDIVFPPLGDRRYEGDDRRDDDRFDRDMDRRRDFDRRDRFDRDASRDGALGPIAQGAT